MDDRDHPTGAHRPVFFLDCREADWLLSLQRDTRLGLRQRLALRLHLAICAHCRVVQRSLERLARMARRLGP